ncbi:hypothetical protein [Prescottella equi]|uniref:Uncharacterized protein n=1 Tax=Prescottella equi ATCC 33707 TaxID=525370 RepID=E9T0N5_RHOHA|nr:hypothetical protein [Prescottella equi]EGD23986.1 hypothetical protein HMPREF0724_12194 [Prescottella equi ATCC 33707]
MSAPNGGVPAGGVSGGGGLAAHAKRTEAQWKASLYGQVNDRYNGVKLFGSDFSLLGNQVRAHNQLIETQGEQIADLEDFVGTGTTTPIWSSAGGYDLVSFPDSMMNRVRYFDGNAYALSEIPAFSQAKRTLDLAFVRGGRDTPTPLEVVRIITGADTGIFDIDAWYVGIYVYDKPNNRMQLLWNSGNLLNVLTGQRMRYHLSTNMTQSAANDQLLAVATLQIAPGLAQRPRGIGCVFQTGISEQAGTVPLARHAYINNVDALPMTIGMNSMNYDNSKIMWAAVGASS